MKLFSRKALLSAAALLATGQMAIAASDGFFLQSFLISDSSPSFVLSVTTVEGDKLTFLYQDGGGIGNVPALGSMVVSVDGSQICTGAACDGATVDVAAGAHSVRIAGQAVAGQSFTIYVQCDGQYLPGYRPGSCTQGLAVVDTGGGTGGTGGTGSSATTSSQVAAATGASSNGVVSSAISRGTGARTGGGGAQVSRDAFFFAAPAQSTNGNWWGQLQAQTFSGSLDGGGAELTLGADWDLGNGTLVGIALSYGDYAVTASGSEISTTALAIGPYLSTSIGSGLTLDAHVLFAKPDYDAGKTTYSSDRIMGGIDLGYDYMIGTTQATGYVAVQGFSEDLPAAAAGGARTISQTMASIGSRFDFAPVSGMRPQVLIGADAIRFDDGTTRTESLSPRVGLTVDTDIGPGTLSFGAEAGNLFKDARSLSLGISYSASF